MTHYKKTNLLYTHYPASFLKILIIYESAAFVFIWSTVRFNRCKRVWAVIYVKAWCFSF